MRTIKFRGKRNKDGEWIYGLLTNDTKGHYRINYNPICFSSIVKPETIGQFTGLLDKNGKEIYEGDIVKYIGNEIGNVFTNEVKYDGSGFNPLDAIYWMSDIENTECEVIGNIHDNPELIDA